MPISKRDRVFHNLIANSYSFARIIVLIGGTAFIIFALITFILGIYKEYTLLLEKERITILVITFAEYLMLSITFAVIGGNVIYLSYSAKIEAKTLQELKEHLFTMVVSTIAIVFVHLVLINIENGITISLLYASSSMAILSISLAVYVYLTK